MNRKQIEALNAAGAALKALGLGKVKLAYFPPDDLVRRESYAVSLDDPDRPGLCIAVGDTPAEALDRALGLAARSVPKAA